MVSLRTMPWIAYALIVATIGNVAIGTISSVAGDASEIVVSTAEQAIKRGYGGMCSLEMVPVKRGEYYPCLDFGPYRVVMQYERTTGYVVMDGKPPFLVMSAGEGARGFLIKGPWETDMAAKILTYWNDVVQGGSEHRKRMEREEAARREAFEYVSKFGSEQKAPKNEDDN